MGKKNCFCKIGVAIFVALLVGGGLMPVSALSKEKEDAIVKKCDVIRDNLKKVQKEDAKLRVNLGGFYETILTKFITPLNVRLIENNLSSAGFVENQNNFVDARALFASDFITYQQGLEDLVGIDCRTEPGKFYDKLTIVRQKRKIMVQDVLKMRNIISEHIKLVTDLRGKL